MIARTECRSIVSRMDLLNGWLVLAAIAVTMIVIVAGFFVVMRPGSGKRRTLRRIVTILVAQVCVLVAAASLINYQFGYFRNHTELWRFLTHEGDTGKIATVPSVPLNELAEQINNGDSSRYRVTWQESDDEGMRQATITGPESAINSQIRTWVPRGFPERGVKYNVMVLLPGTPGSAAAIGPAIGGPRALQEAIDAGKIAPTILITSDMNFGGQIATCADIDGGLKAETWFARDLPKIIQSNFDVSNRPEDWTVVGPSMGGYCAGRLGILHPDVFGNAVWLHGIDMPMEGSLSKVPGVRKAQALSTLAKGADKTANLLFVSSIIDKGTIEDARRVASAVNDPSRVYLDERSEGGHGWVVWIKEFPDVLTWLSKVR